MEIFIHFFQNYADAYQGVSDGLDNLGRGVEVLVDGGVAQGEGDHLLVRVGSEDHGLHHVADGVEGVLGDHRGVHLPVSARLAAVLGVEAIGHPDLLLPDLDLGRTPGVFSSHGVLHCLLQCEVDN